MMKKSEKNVNINEKSQGTTRAERQNAKFVQRAGEELQLCAEAYAFHNAYLTIQLGYEEEWLEALNNRLAELEAERQKAAAIPKRRRVISRKETIEF